MLKGCPGSEKILNCSATPSPLIFMRLKRTSYLSVRIDNTLVSLGREFTSVAAVGVIPDCLMIVYCDNNEIVTSIGCIRDRRPSVALHDGNVRPALRHEVEQCGIARDPDEVGIKFVIGGTVLGRAWQVRLPVPSPTTA
jgi:hypothetical protein